MLVRKSTVVVASAMLVATMVLGAGSHPINAADEVNCDAVMHELYGGKHPKEVAKDLSISTSSVYRCKRHAQAAAKASTKSSMQAQSGKEAPAAPMGASSPAMAAPAAAASPK